MKNKSFMGINNKQTSTHSHIFKIAYSKSNNYSFLKGVEICYVSDKQDVV